VVRASGAHLDAVRAPACSRPGPDASLHPALGEPCQGLPELGNPRPSSMRHTSNSHNPPFRRLRFQRSLSLLGGVMPLLLRGKDPL